MPKVELTLEANVAALKKQLAGVFDKKTATAMIKEYKAAFKEQKKAAEAAAKANKKARKEQDKLKDSLEGTKNAAEALGGKAGELAGRFEKVGQAVGKFVEVSAGKGALAAVGKMGIAFGAVAATAAVAVGSVAALAVGLSKIVLNAAEIARENAEYQEFFNTIDEDKIQDLHAFSDGMDSLKIISQQLQLTLGSELAPELRTMLDIFGRLAMFLVSPEGPEKQLSLFERTAAGLTLALADVFGGNLREDFAEVSNEISGTNDAMADDLLLTKNLGKSYDDLTEKIREQREAREKAAAAAAYQRKMDKQAADEAKKAANAAREAAAAARERERAEDTLSAMIERATADQRDASQELTLQYEKQVEAIQAQGLAGASFELQIKALTEVTERYNRELQNLAETQEELVENEYPTKFGQQWAEAMEQLPEHTAKAISDAKFLQATLTDTILSATDTRMDTLEQEAAAVREAAAAASEAYRESEAAKVEAALEAGQITEAEAAAQLDAIENTQTAQEAAAEDRIAVLEREALKAFKINKAASIAAATIKAAEAAVALLPAFAFLNFGAPLTAAGVAAAALAAQIAAIEAQPPPEFASGGLVADRVSGDHAPILASPTEGIVSARGMSTLGRDGLNQINAGGSIGTEVIVSLDRQIIAQAVADVLTGDRRVRAEVRAISGARTGQALPYGRGR
jgi:hypothetical protein